MAEIFEVSQINEYLRQRFEADEFLGSPPAITISR